MIRLLTKADIAQILPIEEASFKDAWTENMFLDSFESNYFFGYVCQEAGEILGYICGDAIYEDAQLMSVATAPAHRKKGVARRLIAVFEEECKKRGAKIIAVASSYWQNEMPKDHFIRHPNGKNLFDYADVCIDDYNPVGDAVVNVPGMTTPIGPVSNVVDFTIAHLLEIETCRQCVERGIVPPVWNSANAPGGDEKNAAYLAKYKPLVKSL